MKTFTRLLFISAAIFILSAGIALAINITIYDKISKDPTGWYGQQEDNEVEPRCIQAQVWDLEGFFLEGNLLTMVGGYNYQTGVNPNGYTYRSGDLFLNTTGDTAYEYVIHINQIDGPGSFSTYSVYQLGINSTFLTCTDISTSNPWRYSNGGQPLAEYQDLNIIYGTFNGPDGPGSYDFNGDGVNNTHYYATFNLGFLAPGTEFTSHYTMECGNDNLIGQGTTAPVPEPATLLLLGSGLLGLAAFRRKAK